MTNAAAADALQTALQVLQQAFGLLALAGDLVLVTAQSGALGFQGGADTLINRRFPLTQALVFFALGLVVRGGCLQLRTQLLYLGDESGHRVAWRVALDAQRLHFIRCELGAGVGANGYLAPAIGEQPDAEEQHDQGHRNHQPLE